MTELGGGDQLRQKLDDIARKLGKAGTLKVGFFEGATYLDGTSVAEVAAYQEFGTPNAKFPIPPRPFFRNMIYKNSSGWPNTISKLLKTNDYNTYDVLDIMGQEIKGQLQQSIIDTNDPSLSEVTLVLRAMRSDSPNMRITRRTVYEAIARVKSGRLSGLSGTSAKPLVQTGHMLNSVDYQVT